MKAFWSKIARELSPYVPCEQPRIANLVKLNTNESRFGPSALALEAPPPLVGELTVAIPSSGPRRRCR